MAESGLSISYDELRADVAAFLGYGPTAAAWSTAEAAEIDRYVQAGYRRFLYPQSMEGIEPGYQWSFLHVKATLATVADEGVQDLPDALGRVLGNFHYPQADYRQPVTQVPEDQYLHMLGTYEGTGYPRIARVRHKPKEDGRGHRLEVAWWPVPDAAYSLNYQYEAYTGKLDALNQYPLGGMKHAELVKQSCLAVAEVQANDELGIHTEEFKRMLRSAIEQDRRQGAATFGHMGHFDHQQRNPRHSEQGSYDVTYKGTTY